jgi:hypothetical protein
MYLLMDSLSVSTRENGYEKSFLPLTCKIYVQLEMAWHKHFKKVNWTATIYKSRC